MEVILKADVKSLGKAGDKVKVSDGYARNFLFPRNLALEATAGQVRALKNTKSVEEVKQQKILDEARKTAARLQQTAVTVKTRVGEGGKLYGSVTNKDVAEAIEQVSGIVIDKRKVEIKEPIKALGTYAAVVRIHPEYAAEVQVNVVEA